MLYVTISPVFTVTGSFLCLYVAVYSVSIVAVSIDGFLVVDVELDKSVVFPSVMYFLNAMSNGVSFSIDITGWWSSTVGSVYNVTLLFGVIVPSLYFAMFAFAVFTK